MDIFLTLGLFCVLLSNCASAQDGVKKGAFPYMGFVYYDNSQFMRPAVLLQPAWLVTGSLDSVTYGETVLEFPRKTLMARFGAVTIDSKLAFNEDENEQEREVIQLVRPAQHSAAEYWRSDLTLLKVLTQFTVTASVGLAPIHQKHEFTDDSCYILLFVRKSNSEDKILQKFTVDLLPADKEHCGANFDNTAMVCAKDSEDIVNITNNQNYCEGNSGGPLICEGEVSGLQTYIGSCQNPHLYQALSKWNTFLDCGISKKCDSKPCSQICTTTNKDDPKTTEHVAQIGTMQPVEFIRADKQDKSSEFEVSDIGTMATVNLLETLNKDVTESLEKVPVETMEPTVLAESPYETITAKTNAGEEDAITRTASINMFDDETVAPRTSPRIKVKQEQKSWVMQMKQKDPKKDGKDAEAMERSAQVEAQVEGKSKKSVPSKKTLLFNNAAPKSAFRAVVCSAISFIILIPTL